MLVQVSDAALARRHPEPSRTHLPALDGLRAVAVFVVISYHAGVAQGIPGDLGVVAFFVLSGFLITWLLVREFDRDGSISLRDFYIRRTLRIFPAYYVYLAVSFAIDAARGHTWSFSLAAASLSYTVNYYNAVLGHPPTSVAHAWSLAVEEQFYLLWPVAFIWLWGRGRAAARRALLCTIVAVGVWRSVAYLGLGLSASYAYNAFETRCDSLAIGCLMAVLASSHRYRRFELASRASPLLPLVTLALLWVSRMQMGLRYHYSVGMTIDAVLLAIFIVQMLGLSRNRLWGWLDHPITRWLGAVSYPCYLYHSWGLSVGLHLLPGWPRGLVFVAGYGTTLLLAAGSFYVIERPALAIRATLSSGPRALAVETL